MFTTVHHWNPLPLLKQEKTSRSVIVVTIDPYIGVLCAEFVSH